MSGKTALIVIYNHHPHAENIPVVEKIYGERFSDIYHLVPVAPGFAPMARESGRNVIAVHGKSFYFHGWMAQGLRHYFRDEYTHYFFIHDDLILNPGINENNFREHLKLERDDTAFTTNFYTLHQRLEWDYAPEAYRFRGRVAPLPSFEEALTKFSAHGLEIRPLSLHRSLLTRDVYMPCPGHSLLLKFISRLRLLKLVLRRLAAWPAGERKLAYPLVGGYPDMAVVPAASIREFCRYCEAFAEARLFVAIAMPTALALSCEKINTHEDIPLWGWHYWPYKSWALMRSRCDERKLNDLLENFPEECLFIHPVKLSP